MSYKHKQLEGHELLIGKHFKGANDDNRVTARMGKACEAVISKEMSVIHAAVRFGVDKDKLVRILNLK